MKSKTQTFLCRLEVLFIDFYLRVLLIQNMLKCMEDPIDELKQDIELKKIESK